LRHAPPRVYGAAPVAAPTPHGSPLALESQVRRAPARIRARLTITPVPGSRRPRLTGGPKNRPEPPAGSDGGWWSVEELFGDDPLLERVVGVAQQLHGGRGVFCDGDRHDVEQLMEVGGGGQGPLVGIEVLHHDLGGGRHQGNLPASPPGPAAASERG